MKKIYFIIVVFILFSCNSHYSIVGTYRIKIKEYEPRQSQSIKIFQDSTFEYSSSMGWAHKEWSKGTWKVDDRKNLQLKSYFSCVDSIPMYIDEKIDTCVGSKLFLLKNIDRRIKLLKWYLIINDRVTYPIEKDSIYIDYRIKVDKISVHAYFDNQGKEISPPPINDTMKTITYNVNNINSNIINIGLPSYFDFNMIFFVPINDVLKIRINALILTRDGRKIKYDREQR